MEPINHDCCDRDILNIAGIWVTDSTIFGVIHFTQKGDVVTGIYNNGYGVIAGNMYPDHWLRAQWEEQGRKGLIVLNFSEITHFDGFYGFGFKEKDLKNPIDGDKVKAPDLIRAEPFFKQHSSITTIASEHELTGVNLKKDRGTITKITFEIIYPDKTKKIVAYDFEWIDQLAGILFDESIMNDIEKKLFTESRADWTQNPAFIKISRDGLRAGSCCKNPGHSGDDCWGWTPDIPK